MKHAKHAEANQPTLFPISDFALAEASVFHKRTAGRPKGPRGFVFFNRFRGATDALAACLRWLTRAVKASRIALVLRRMNGVRCALARFSALEGRVAVSCALSCYVSAFCYFQGGAL